MLRRSPRTTRTLALARFGAFLASVAALVVPAACVESAAPIEQHDTAGPTVSHERRIVRALVRIVDADGKPWGGTVDAERRTKWIRRRSADVTRLDVTVARTDANALDPFEDLASTLTAVGSGGFAFDAVVGRNYTAALHGGGIGFVAHDVTIGEGDASHELVLVARENGNIGTLSVRPHNVHGKAFPCRLALRLEEPTTGIRILDESDPDPDPSWITRSVPPGTYTLVVEGEPLLDWIHGTVLGARTYGGSVTTIDVRAGETTWVEPVMGEGARVQVAITGRHDANDRDALTKVHPTMTVGDLDAWASLVEIQLLAPSRWPVPVRFRDDGPFPDSEGPNLRSELPFGAEQTSELLTSGTYTLEARTRGGRVATVPVVLVDGLTTSVRLEIP